MNFTKCFTPLILLVIIPGYSFCQNRGNIWCFGDSSGIDFNSSIPMPIVTGFDTRGSCVSVADNSGDLIFYANTRAGLSGNTGLVWNLNHTIMINGDNIVGQGWYNEMVVIDDLNNDSIYYLFSVGVTNSGSTGLFYSIIDLSQNNGLGAVTQKNIQLQNFANVDCLNAIKHGNGRDWWVFTRRWQPTNPQPNNEYHSYLITPYGISNYTVQNIGSGSYTGLGKITFSPEGDKMVFSSYAGMLELYDFDRCTGTISSPVTLGVESWGVANHFWGCEFSPNGNVLYLTISDQTSYLLQFDLTAPDIWASRDTLWVTGFPGEAIGGLKRGPDGKIYQSGPYTNPSFYNYPYPDSVYNMYNMNLGVINYPDSLGPACDFQPYSFYLGGKRTYWGLPNNPDYDLGPLVGSPCDTLVGINEPASIANTEMFVYYASGWQTAFINAQHVAGSRYNLEVFDIMGKSIFRESGKLNPPYFTKNLNCASFATGVYTVVLETEKQRLVKRFVKE